MVKAHVALGEISHLRLRYHGTNWALVELLPPVEGERIPYQKKVEIQVDRGAGIYSVGYYSPDDNLLVWLGPTDVPELGWMIVEWDGTIETDTMWLEGKEIGHVQG